MTPPSRFRVTLLGFREVAQKGRHLDERVHDSGIEVGAPRRDNPTEFFLKAVILPDGQKFSVIN